jgi:hypothetical protein
MRLKGTVMELLARGDSDGLERLVAAEPRAGSRCRAACGIRTRT